MKLVFLWIVVMSMLPNKLCAAGIPALLPLPQKLTWNNQSFRLSGQPEIQLDRNFDKIFSDLYLKELSPAGKNTQPKLGKPYLVILKKVSTISKNPYSEAESYTLHIDSSSIVVAAVSNHGIFNALQTMRQLIVRDPSGSSLRGCDIADWPAFRFRGFMHDAGRSYIGFEELKKEIELLSHYKINVFHWHLTENLAWRIESKVLPSLTDSTSMLRHKGKFYTQVQARDLVRFCKEHQVLLIPEIDMPGHSDAFHRATGLDMQSPKGKELVGKVLAEMCGLFEVPYIHLGTDEVRIIDKNFVAEMATILRDHHKEPMGWYPGSDNGRGGLRQMWTGGVKPIKGMRVVDSRFYYLNHTDPFADLKGIFSLQVCDTLSGGDEREGGILCIWNDRISSSDELLLLQNDFYPMMLTAAEKFWCGGGLSKKEWSVCTDQPGDQTFKLFRDFENRLLEHKKRYFEEIPFPYVRQTNVCWRITDAFPNKGNLTTAFPPEREIALVYHFGGTDYATRLAYGAAIYLRHYWGKMVPAFYADPKPNSTAYAFTQIYSPKEQQVGMWIGFHNFGRSEKDATPPAGKWDYKESAIWLNDAMIAPPAWENGGKKPANGEIPYVDENFELRAPTPVHLHQGWNKLLVKIPVGQFSDANTRLVKWMFTAVFVTADGRDAVEGLIYSPDKILPNS